MERVHPSHPMIEIGIIDLSADGRRKIAALVERWSWVNPESRQLSLPSLSTQLLSPEEVRFHGSLDVCLVGPELVACDLAYVAVIRKQLPNQILICVLDNRSYSFGTVEQLGRMEVDDVLMDTASSDEFFRRLVLLTRKVSRKKQGQLVVVDAARGGVGGTFISAGLAETYLNNGKTVCLVDSDVVSQDLSRFLQCKPFINEPLKVLMDQQRVVTKETIKDCIFQVWLDEERFKCVPPPAASDEASFACAGASRSFVAALETLNEIFDVVIVDASPLVASVRHALYQVANDVILVVNRDPAASYANRHALSIISGFLRRESKVTVVVNETFKHGVALTFLQSDVLVAGEHDLDVVVVPYSIRAGRWACSGSTPARYIPRPFTRILAVVSGAEVEGSLEEKASLHLWRRLTEFGRAIVRRYTTRLARTRSNAAERRNFEAVPGVVEVEPSASRELLPLLVDMQDADTFISKPTLDAM